MTTSTFLRALGRRDRHDRGDLDALQLRAVRHRRLHRTGRVDHDQRAVERRDVRDREIERAAERALPVVRRRVLVGRPDLVREQARLRDLGRVGDLRDDGVDGGLADAGLVEVPEVAHECHRTHRRDHRLPRLGIHAARQPARQPLPREPGLGERGRAALAQERAPRVERGRLERRCRCEGRQRGRVRDGVVVMTTVEQVLEQRRLLGVARATGARAR